MPTTDVLTYEQTPPRRPALSDLDGGTCADDTEFPPDPNVGPSALAMNQRDKLMVGLCGITPAVVLEVHFSAGAPSIYYVGGMRTGLVAGDFTVVDNGDGDTSITHTGGKLPPATWSAGAEQVDDTEIDRIRVVSITNGWRVKTKLGSTGMDANFVLRVSGL